MASAATIALNNHYNNSTDGSSNVALSRLLLRLANAAAMDQSYTGKRPITAVAEFLESFGENQITKQFRRDHSHIINEEAKLV